MYCDPSITAKAFAVSEPFDPRKRIAADLASQQELRLGVDAQIAMQAPHFRHFSCMCDDGEKMQSRHLLLASTEVGRAFEFVCLCANVCADVIISIAAAKREEQEGAFFGNAQKRKRKEGERSRYFGAKERRVRRLVDYVIKFEPGVCPAGGAVFVVDVCAVSILAKAQEDWGGRGWRAC